jgi:hypothetical protein
MADKFCTIEELELFLQLDISSSPEAVASAEQMIEDVTAAIRNYTNQQISEVVGDTITIDGPGKKRIFLPELPITEITSVIEDGDTLTQATDFILGQFGILYRLGGYNWSDGYNNIDITYTHGYSTIPLDIKSVCIRGASRIFQASLRSKEFDGLSGVSAMKLGDYSIQLGSERGGGMGEGILGVSAAQSLLSEDRRILDKYKHKRI